MTISSGYNVNREPKFLDILVMYTYIPKQIWFRLLISYLAFVFLLSIGLARKSTKKKKRSSATWMTTCAFLNQNNFPNDTAFILMISSVTTIALFYLMSYIRNCIMSLKEISK